MHVHIPRVALRAYFIRETATGLKNLQEIPDNRKHLNYFKSIFVS